MTKRLPVTVAPGPLERYAVAFDSLFGQRNQRQAFRRCLEGLLLPAERNKTLTMLANTEPIVGAQEPRAQGLQWFLSESTWDSDAVNARRLELLRADVATEPTGEGVLVIDEHGDRKWGNKTAHVGKQYLANLGKIDNGVVSVTTLWADERVYYPLDFEPYTPAHHFEHGKSDPRFRTKREIALQLVEGAVKQAIPLRAVVADCFYGEDEELKMGLRRLGAGYVLALKPSHCWWHREGEVGSLSQAAQMARWESDEEPGRWVRVERRFRDGHAEVWWALEIEAGPYGVDSGRRAVVVSTDPEKLPGLTTWYLETNLPAVESKIAREEGALHAADLAEVVRLYGLRMWVEQSYKQTKHSLGWSQYQVRSDRAIRRHWELVCCAFSFCWYNQSYSVGDDASREAGMARQLADADTTYPATSQVAGRGENKHRESTTETDGDVADGTTSGPCVAGALDNVVALLERMVTGAPSSSTPQAA